MQYMVFSSRQRPTGFSGATYADWNGGQILGVYEGDTVEEVCLQAAQDHGELTTFFAIPGEAWGVGLLNKQVNKIGSRGSSQDRIAALMERQEQTQARMLELQEQVARAQLPAGDDS